MDIKKFLLPISLAFLTMWAVQYFIFNHSGTNNGGTRSGQTFVAPQGKMEILPLNREVDFIDADGANAVPAVTTFIDTPHASYLFSNKGACLEQLTFKRLMKGEQVALRTIEATPDLGRENRCFLIALDQKTPYNYLLVDHRQLETATQLVYKAETEQAAIEKIFTIYQSKFQVDVTIKITPKKSEVRARLFFPAPALQEANSLNPADNNKPRTLIKDDVISAIFNTQKGSISKEGIAKVDLSQGWLMPTLFGSEDRYFVHALVSDQQGFAQRAYYSIVSQTGLISILESSSIAQPTEWGMSFYFGPKEDEAMNGVDPRLTQTLDHSGILAPLSRLLLLILKYLYSFLHNYGWAIIVMTLLINLILLPLNLKSAQSMKKYADFQKKLTYLQQRYKDDPDTLARERTELISKNGMPGVGGCLTKLMQLPIFFALSRVLSSSIELYKAPFILWIHDLSAPDPLYILPMLIMVSMILQPVSNDPKQRFTMIAVALVFGALATKFSAGLCLYIFVGVLLNGLQMLFQQKMKWA